LWQIALNQKLTRFRWRFSIAPNISPLVRMEGVFVDGGDLPTNVTLMPLMNDPDDYVGRLPIIEPSPSCSYTTLTN